MLFRDGPCSGRSRSGTYATAPRTQVCSGARYHINLHDSEGSVLVYVLADGPHDDTTLAEVRGRRDVFQAFRRLMHVATYGVGGELKRIHGARQRIKRAVR